jgi:hypothetical protein
MVIVMVAERALAPPAAAAVTVTVDVPNGTWFCGLVLVIEPQLAIPITAAASNSMCIHLQPCDRLTCLHRRDIESRARMPIGESSAKIGR